MFISNDIVNIPEFTLKMINMSRGIHNFIHVLPRHAVDVMLHSTCYYKFSFKYNGKVMQIKSVIVNKGT